MIQRWAQGKSFRCPAYIISFFFFFFPCLKPAGLFHACNFAGTEGKARRFNAGENCFFWGGRKRLLAGLKCAGLLDLQSSRAHLRSQRAHMTYTHINTMYDSRAVVDEPRERERRKKKSITVMIDFAAGWADLEPPCCSSNSRRIWEDVGVPLLLYAPIHSNPPRPTYKSHLRPVIQKNPPSSSSGSLHRITLLCTQENLAAGRCVFGEQP